MNRVPFIDTPEAQRHKIAEVPFHQLDGYYRSLAIASVVNLAVSFLIGFCIGAATILLFNRFH